MCGEEAGRQQPHQGLLADSLQAAGGEDAVRDGLLGGGHGVLEAAGVLGVTAATDTPGNHTRETCMLRGPFPLWPRR